MNKKKELKQYSNNQCIVNTAGLEKTNLVCLGACIGRMIVTLPLFNSY